MREFLKADDCGYFSFHPQFQGLVDPSKYFQIITNDYARASAECPTLIKQGSGHIVFIRVDITHMSGCIFSQMGDTQ